MRRCNNLYNSALFVLWDYHCMDVIFDWNLGNMIYNGLITLRLCGFPFVKIGVASSMMRIATRLRIQEMWIAVAWWRPSRAREEEALRARGKGPAACVESRCAVIEPRAYIRAWEGFFPSCQRWVGGMGNYWRVFFCQFAKNWRMGRRDGKLLELLLGGQSRSSSVLQSLPRLEENQ